MNTLTRYIDCFEVYKNLRERDAYDGTLLEYQINVYKRIQDLLEFNYGFHLEGKEYKALIIRPIKSACVYEYLCNLS